MRILILADIHSNWPALAAIQEPFDACLFVGDLVDYGADPVPCIDWVRKHALATVRGNHDHAVAQRIQVRKTHGLHQLAAATRPLHWQLLSPLHMKFLARMPVTRRVLLDGKRFYLVHATPRDPFDEYLRDDKEAWESRLKAIDADFVLVGHTHLQYSLEVGATTVVNPGSVGQPRDGDPRCAYAMIEDGRVELRRVEYDIDETLQRMRDCGIDSGTVALAESILKSGGRPESEDARRWQLWSAREQVDPRTNDDIDPDEDSGITESDTTVLPLSDNVDADEPTAEIEIPPELGRH